MNPDRDELNARAITSKREGLYITADVNGEIRFLVGVDPQNKPAWSSDIEKGCCYQAEWAAWETANEMAAIEPFLIIIRYYGEDA